MIVEVREITLDDAPALADYAARLFAERLPGIFDMASPTLEQEVEFLRPFVDSRNSAGLVALANGDICAFGTIMGMTRSEEAHVGELSISVANGFRGRGIGEGLIEALCHLASENGVWRVMMHAWANNTGALRLYERLGFEREGVLRRAIVRDGELIDAIVLAKLLT